MIFGYARVSSQEQSLDRQLDSLKAAGAEEIVQEEITGTKADRPELNRLLDKLRSGDIVIILLASIYKYSKINDKSSQ